MNTYQISNKRTGHVVVLAAVLLLMSIVVWAFFFKNEPLPLDGTGIMIVSIVGVFGTVCLFMSIKMLIQNPAVITINDKGFEYNPGGVSSGFMHWSNVASIKFIDVRTSQGTLNGPIWERTLALTLKDPSLYRDQFNPLMKGLMKVNSNMYEGDLFFRLSSFGKKADEVYGMMMKYWNESKNEIQNE